MLAKDVRQVFCFGDIYRRRTVGTAYYRYCASLCLGKSEDTKRAEKRNKYAELRSGSDYHTLRICNQRTEVGHRAYTEEYYRRENNPVDTFIYVIKQSEISYNLLGFRR